MKISIHILYGGDTVVPQATNATNSTSVKQPWAPAQPYLKEIMANAAKIYAQGPAQYTPFSQVANFDPLQLSAQNGITNYVNSSGTQNFMNTAANTAQNAISGNPNDTQNVANGGMSNVAGLISNNNMFDPAHALNQMAYGNNMNPYTAQNANAAMQKISNNFSMNTLPGMRRNAIGNGTYGSSRNELSEGLAAGNMANDMYNTSAQIYGNAYNTAQSNSLNALGQSAQQQLNQAGMTNSLFNAGNNQNLNAQSIGLQNFVNSLNMPLSMLEQLGQVGLQQHQQNQNQLNDATNRWNFNQNSNWDNLGRFKQLLDGNAQYGGSGAGASNSVSYSPPVNNASQIIGALLTTAGLASQFGGNNK